MFQFRHLFVLGIAFTAFGADTKPDDEPKEFTGKVQLLSKIPGEKAGKPDADAVAFVADDGTVYPLVNDDVSKLLFLDPKLLDRPVKLTGRADAGKLKLTKVQTVVKGVVHNIDYWCENCQYGNPSPGPCMCCGGPTEFRERPVK